MRIDQWLRDGSDPYFDKIQKAEDPIIRKALERMLRAARAAIEAGDYLRYAMKDLERHPDFLTTERARRKGRHSADKITLAWWIHNCAHGVFNDATVDEAGDWLLHDSNPRRVAATLRQFQETERQDLTRFARRKARRPAKAQRTKRTELREVQSAA